jgi:hypothetical protein
MTRAVRHLRSWISVLALVAVASVSMANGAGCILADPPADLPSSPQARPTILHGSVVPSPTSVLGTFPDKFVIPIEFADPTASFQWSSFVDYNPAGNREGFRASASVAGAPPGSPRVRTLEVVITPPPETDRCHVIDVVVGLSLDTATARVPEPPGGDIVTWFYSPGGDLAGCPSLDGGVEASIDADGGTLESGTPDGPEGVP